MVTVTLGSDSSSADELVRGCEESEAIDTGNESASGAATTAQQRAKATVGSKHGRTTCEHGMGRLQSYLPNRARSRQIVSDSHPQTANVTRSVEQASTHSE